MQVVAPSASDKGDPFAFAGVYDGHGELMQQQQHMQGTQCYALLAWHTKLQWVFRLHLAWY